MAYGAVLVSVPEHQVVEFQNERRAVLEPSRTIVCSHLIAYWIHAQPLGRLLAEAVDGGQPLHPALWHPLVKPAFHSAAAVRDLERRITSTWNHLVEQHADDSAAEGFREEIVRVLALFAHAASRDEAVVHFLQPPADEDRASRVVIPLRNSSSPSDAPAHATRIPLESLDGTLRERYFALAVLPGGMPIPLPLQQILWNADEPNALATAERLMAGSLARRGDERGSIVLDDLHFDQLRARFPDHQSLDLIHGAVRLSLGVIEKDPWQFVSQMSGRLLPHQAIPAIRKFMQTLAGGARQPWLRLLQPALHPPGTALVRTLEGHSHRVTCVAMTPDGQYAVSASADRALKVWDLESGRQLRTLDDHISAVAMSADGRRAISGSPDTTLKVWDLETGRRTHTLAGHDGAVTGVSVAADWRRAVSASHDGTLKMWDLETGRELRTIARNVEGLCCVAVSLDGRRAVSGSQNNTLKVWDLEAGRELCTLKGHANTVAGVAVSSNGRRAASSSFDRTVRLWDLETCRELRTMNGHSDTVYGIVLSPDGSRAVSASADKTLKVWDVETGRVVRTLEGHCSGVDGVALSAQGSRAISASWDHTLKVWDLDAGRELRELLPHAPYVAVSGDGLRAIFASGNGTLTACDFENLRPLRTLDDRPEILVYAAMSADGRRAKTASAENTMKLWDVEGADEPRSLLYRGDTIGRVLVSADGRRAVAASFDEFYMPSDCSLHVLNCNPVTWSAR
jgi:WD40 repeat protein